MGKKVNGQELQKRNKPRSNPLLWLLVMGISGALVLYLFISLYKKGAKVGEVTPKAETAIKTEGGKPAIDLEKFKISTPELVGKGDGLFQINCASCHGPKGQGDGPRAKELNPPPRNFHSEKFKFGALASQIFNTVTNGSPGTSMPSFALLPAEDRWALVHFVRSQIPNPPQEPEGPAQVATASTAGSEVKTQPTTTTEPAQPEPEKEGPRIPIALALQRMAVPVAETATPVSLELEQKGAVLFSRYCMPCHGPSGEPRQTVYLLRINPERFVRSGNLQNPKAVWVNNKERFEEIVTRGFPGHLMPGLKSLSQSEIDALYAHVLKLATTSSERR